MPHYLYKLSYTPDAMKAMIAHPTDRKAAATKLASAMGGTLHHLFFAFGEADVICLIEAPDDTSMMAVSAILAASGTVASASTMRLYSQDDAMKALAMAGKASAAYVTPQKS